MVDAETLKQILLFKEVPLEGLAGLAEFGEVQEFTVDELVCHQGAEARRFFSLINGKILLQMEISQGITASLGSVKPGYSFGFISLDQKGRYHMEARCTDPCTVVAFDAAKFMDHLDNNPTVGHAVMKRLALLLENRLARRTQQLLSSLGRQVESMEICETPQDNSPE